MEPLSMILTALAAGAVSAVQETAATAVKDAYQGLRALIEKKFADQPKGTELVEEYTTDPETWEKPLAKELEKVGADQDEKILQAAQQLLEMLQAAPEGGKYNVQVSDSQGVVVGDHAQVEMNFGQQKKKKT